MLNKQRLIQAVSFEVGSLVLFALIFVPLFDLSIAAVGVIGLAFSVATVILLYFYNIFFDKLLKRLTGSVKKSSSARVFHAFFFEASLLIIGLPLLVWTLNISLFEAFMMEIAAITFMIVYVYIFHWVVERYFVVES